jgi:hypothetical protein
MIMAYMNENYSPNTKGREILDAAWKFISQVPYKVTTRWLFYQLLQAGFYSSKDDYSNKCIPLLSRARHSFYEGWRPNTLVDDRRESIDHTGGYHNIQEWVKSFSEGGFICDLDHFYRQDQYIEVWYEAEAMSRQFQHYIEKIVLRPFSGMPSISYKWTIAKDLEEKHSRYEKPIIILYFGDYDQAGLTIPETSIADIRKWCDVDFQVDRRGLNRGDEIRYNIPENIDKPGAYQWEALPDKAAGEIITNSIKEYIDTRHIGISSKDGWKAARLFNDYVAGFSDYFSQNSTIG